MDGNDCPAVTTTLCIYEMTAGWANGSVASKVATIVTQGKGVQLNYFMRCDTMRILTRQNRPSLLVQQVF